MITLKFSIMIQNQARFTGTELEAIFGASNLINIAPEAAFMGISTDTRLLKNNNIFVALKGENIDGHTKVSESLDKDAGCALVLNDWYFENKNNLTGKSFILTSNTGLALASLAKFHRMRFNIPVFAVAGSNGKTTTKNIISHLLQQKYNIVSTYGNFNNQLGTPLVLLQIDESTQIAVIEIGTNEPGEIYILSEMVAPTHGLITNIGKEHLEKLIDLDGVEMEETALFAYLMKSGGISLINCDDPRLERYSAILENKFKYGKSEANDLIFSFDIDEELHPSICFKHESNNFAVKLKTYGLATAYNAAAAAAVAVIYGLSSEEIIEGLESYSEESGSGYSRNLLEKSNGLIILNDCYNANPSSMALALDSIALLKSGGKKIAILGDMLELGEFSSEEHVEILSKASNLLDEVYTFGPQMFAASEKVQNNNIYKYINKAVLVADLKGNIKIGDIILLKGSRGMKMEELLPILREI
ncbi:MAG: UDP-N-acetylmuramoyl-tripeptide--D-alanyl-D-alanine ligase [Candidatus Kapabacteria bacterium]|nr:UDP-N-acetylmuramoyl-tripeptide--D-alanyl-D-alanine ligase [Candidatus Kapabacteria bacterium]